MFVQGLVYSNESHPDLAPPSVELAGGAGIIVPSYLLPPQASLSINGGYTVTIFYRDNGNSTGYA